MTAVDLAAQIASIRRDVAALKEQADTMLEQIDKLAGVCKAIDDLRNVQQSLRQAIGLVLDHLDKIAPK